MSSFLDKLEAVFYGVVGLPVDLSHLPKFFMLDYWKRGHEMRTLSKLYGFCRSNPTVKVQLCYEDTVSNVMILNSFFSSFLLF